MNTNSATPTPVSIKEEMDFRLSLLRLMTVPHEGVASVSPSACRQVEELSVLVPKQEPQRQQAKRAV